MQRSAQEHFREWLLQLKFVFHQRGDQQKFLLWIRLSVLFFFRFHRNHHMNLPFISVLFTFCYWWWVLISYLHLKTQKRCTFHCWVRLPRRHSVTDKNFNLTIFLQQGVHSNSDQPRMKRPSILPYHQPINWVQPFNSHPLCWKPQVHYAA